MGVFQGTQERVRNSHGKRAISVRAIEVLLYISIPSSITKKTIKIKICFTVTPWIHYTLAQPKPNFWR